MAQPITSPGSQRKRGRSERSRRGLVALLAISASFGFAGLPQAAGPKLLPAEEAFRLSARALDPGTLEIRYDVADGYYLYRDKLRFAVEPAIAEGVDPQLPAGKVPGDEYCGKRAIRRGPPVSGRRLRGGKPGGKGVLTADSQGCADAGVCYPPQRQTLTVVLPAAGGGAGVPVEAAPRRKSYFN